MMKNKTTAEIIKETHVGNKANITFREVVDAAKEKMKEILEAHGEVSESKLYARTGINNNAFCRAQMRAVKELQREGYQDTSRIINHCWTPSLAKAN